MDDYSYKVIEELNEEYYELLYSKEYLLGKNIISTKDKVRTLDMIGLIKKIREKVFLKAIDSGVSKKNEVKTESFEIVDKQKVVVYTCITSGYDMAKPPLVKDSNIKLVLFTDENRDIDGWEIQPIPSELKGKSGAYINRYIKMHPFQYFDNYDYSIYIDGNVRIIGDITSLVCLRNTRIGLGFHIHNSRDDIKDEITACKYKGKGNYKEMKKQVDSYYRKGFPPHYGMLECGVVVVDLNNDIGKKILDEWWEEFLNNGLTRDQICLPYVLWQNNILAKDVGTLGTNFYRNHKIRVEKHKWDI